jgi:hypothetical protein
LFWWSNDIVPASDYRDIRVFGFAREVQRILRHPGPVIA